VAEKNMLETAKVIKKIQPQSHPFK